MNLGDVGGLRLRVVDVVLDPLECRLDLTDAIVQLKFLRRHLLLVLFLLLPVELDVGV